MALNKVEMLPWDTWGVQQPPPDAYLDAEDMRYFDDLARLSAAPEANLAELRSRYFGDPGLIVPDRVYNACCCQWESW